MEKYIGRRIINKRFSRKSDFDLRHKIMLVDYRFAEKVDSLQLEMNLQMEKIFGKNKRKKRPPVSKVMITGLIAEKLKSPTIKRELGLNI